LSDDDTAPLMAGMCVVVIGVLVAGMSELQADETFEDNWGTS